MTSAQTVLPKIAVVGGGISGTLCSLVLKNRGLHPVILDQGTRGIGGRLRGGAQFIRTSNPALAPVFQMLHQNGLIEEWKGKFGMLGSSGGGFLPAEIVTNITNSSPGSISGLSPAAADMESEVSQTNPALVTDGGDFCNFVEGHIPKSSPTFVGMPTLADLCSNICKLADIEVMEGTKVTEAEMLDKSIGGWKVYYESVTNDTTNEKSSSDDYDALVIASHDPSLASTIIRKGILNAEIKEAGYGTDLQTALLDLKNADPNFHETQLLWNRLNELAARLQSTRETGRFPLFTVMVTYPETFSDSIPFDAVSVPGSSFVQFLSRNASKPGRDGVSSRCTWTAVTTSLLASDVLAKPEWSQEEQENYIQRVVTGEMAQLFQPYFSNSETPNPIKVSAKRWSSAICGKSLGLEEDSIMLRPWRMAIAGDFIRDCGMSSSRGSYITPIEHAAMSGLESGERIASIFINNLDEQQQQPQE